MDQRGITLVEATIGLGILATVAIVVAALLMAGRGATSRSREASIALWLARGRLEQLESLTFSVTRLPVGSEVLLTDGVTDLSRDLPALGGAGLAPSPPDSLSRDRPGYVDYLDEYGRWVGADPGVLPQASYVRRWAIARAGAGASELVAFDVIVFPARHAAAADRDVLRLAGVVRLSGARARRAA